METFRDKIGWILGPSAVLVCRVSSHRGRRDVLRTCGHLPCKLWLLNSPGTEQQRFTSPETRKYCSVAHFVLYSVVFVFRGIRKTSAFPFGLWNYAGSCFEMKPPLKTHKLLRNHNFICRRFSKEVVHLCGCSKLRGSVGV